MSMVSRGDGCESGRPRGSCLQRCSGPGTSPTVPSASTVAILATVDADGFPRTAPFGSLRAITPRLLRLFSWREHDTYTNLCRDGRVSVALVGRDVAVSVAGRARVVRERADNDEQFAILEIDVEEVKNDMAYRVLVEGGIEIVPKERHRPWYSAVMAELADMELG